MVKKILCCFTFSFLLFFGTGWKVSEAQFSAKNPETQTGTLEKMIVGSGSVTMDLDLDRLRGIAVQETKRNSVRFEVGPESFFTVLVFDNVLRGPARWVRWS